MRLLRSRPNSSWPSPTERVKDEKEQRTPAPSSCRPRAPSPLRTALGRTPASSRSLADGFQRAPGFSLGSWMSSQPSPGLFSWSSDITASSRSSYRSHPPSRHLSLSHSLSLSLWHLSQHQAVTASSLLATISLSFPTSSSQRALMHLHRHLFFSSLSLSFPMIYKHKPGTKPPFLSFPTSPSSWLPVLPLATFSLSPPGQVSQLSSHKLEKLTASGKIPFPTPLLLPRTNSQLLKERRVSLSWFVAGMEIGYSLVYVFLLLVLLSYPPHEEAREKTKQK